MCEGAGKSLKVLVKGRISHYKLTKIIYIILYIFRHFSIHPVIIISPAYFESKTQNVKCKNKCK